MLKEIDQRKWQNEFYEENVEPYMKLTQQILNLT